MLRDMGKLPAEERPVIGKLANEVRTAIESAIAGREEQLTAREMEAKLSGESIDVTPCRGCGPRGANCTP